MSEKNKNISIDATKDWLEIRLNIERKLLSQLTSEKKDELKKEAELQETIRKIKSD